MTDVVMHYDGPRMNISTATGRCSRCGHERECVEIAADDSHYSVSFCKLLCWPNLLTAIAEGQELSQ